MEDIMNGVTSLLMGILNEGLVILILCFVVGEIIKNSSFKILKKIDNQNIPLITAVIGIGLSFIPSIFPDDTIVIAIIKGAICGWSATGLYETYRNYKKKFAKEQCEAEKEVIDETKNADTTEN